MTQLFSNNIDTALEQAAGASDASLLLVDGSDLNEPAGGDFELLTVTYNGLFEVVKVTARTTNTVTVTRAQEGTTARDWPKGARVFAGITAGTLQAFQGAIEAGNGWTPILAIVNDGSRRVLQVYDWTGGVGTKPKTGQYVGSGGLEDAIGDGIDIRGSAGSDGLDGWNPYLAIENDGDRRVLKLENWFGGEGTKPSFIGYYLNDLGLTTSLAAGTDIRGPAGGGGWDPSQAVKDSLTMVAGFSLPPGATALGAEAIAIQAARATDDLIASGNYSVAIGSSSSAPSNQGVAIGQEANCNVASAHSLLGQNYGTAIGYGAICTGAAAVALTGMASGEGSVAIGVAQATGDNAFALGAFANASDDFGIILGAGGSEFRGHFRAAGLPAVASTSLLSSVPDSLLPGAHADYTTQEAIITSGNVNLAAVGDVEIELPAGVHFFPDECGIIITTADGAISQAEVSFGAGTGASEELVAEVVTTGLDAPHKRQRFTSILSDHGQTTLSAHVATAGAGTIYTARFYWKGFAVCDEA